MTIFSIRNSIRNSAWLISEKIFRFLFGFLISTLIIKHLGPTDFGYFSYSLTISSVFGLLSKFGLDIILVKELSEDNANESKLLSNTLFLRVFISLLSILIVIPTLYLFNENNLIITLVSIFLIANIFQSFELFEAYFQSKLKNKISSIIAVCVLIISAFLRIYFLYLELGVVYFALALLFEIFFLFIVLLIYVKRQNIVFEFPSTTICKELISKSYPLLISSIFAFIYLKIDTIMLRFMTDIESVGIYSSAVKISEMIYLFPILISNSFFPLLVKSIKNIDNYKKLSFNLLLINFSICFTFILGLTFSASWLVDLIYNPLYANAALVIQIHVWSILFITINSVCSKLIIIKNKQFVFIKISIIGALLNIILNAFLISYDGIYGAAYSTLISYFVVSSLIYYYFKKLMLDFKKI
jgi:O-antigen/teichoic acid export membrane protein